MTGTETPGTFTGTGTTGRLARSIAFLALLAACASGRFERKGEAAPYEVRATTFPSGLRLVVYSVPQVERFSVTVSYGAGSADDPPGKEGLAHLVEHLAYRAAPGGGAPLFDRLVAGALLFNASTGFDETDYWVAGKPGDLDAALAIEAARMRAPLEGVTDAEATVERDVVLAEWRERFETDPDGAQVQWLLEAVFEGHPYGRPVAGTPGSIRGLALSDARAWAAPRYAPANAIVVVVAPGPVEETARRVEAALADLARSAGEPVRPVPPRTPGPPSAARGGRRKESAPVPQPVLWVAWPAPGSGSRREPQGFYAAAALEAAFAGKLRQAFGKTAPDVVEDFSAGYLPFDGAGLIVLRAELAEARDAGRIADLARSAAFEVRTDEDVKGGPEVGAFGATERRALGDADKTRVAKAVRDALLVGVDLGMESLDGSEIARSVRLSGDPDVPAAWRHAAPEQLEHDPGRLAASVLLRERAVVLEVRPDANALAGAVVTGSARGERRDEDPARAGPAPDAAAARAAAGAPGLDRAERRVLPNGLAVVIARRGALPVAQVELVVRTAAEGGPGVPPGAPAVALASVRAGLAERDLALVGAGRALRRSAEYLRRVERGTSANLDVLLESAAQWALDQHVRFFDEARALLARRLARRERQPDVAAARALHGALFPGHPYGAWPTAEGLGRLGSGDAERWLGEEIRPERATLIVVSDRPPAEVWRLVEARFGGWPRGEAPRPDVPSPPLPPTRRILLVDRPGASQALVAVGLRTPPREAWDEPALDAVRWLAQARLDRRLRIEEGASYGVALGMVEHARGAAVLVAAAVAPAAAAESLAEMLATFRDLAAAPPAEPDVARARFHVARELGFAFDTVSGAAAGLTTLAAHDLPPDHWDRQPASIAALDPDRIHRAAASLAVGREVAVVLGDAAALGPRLEAAGFSVEAVNPGTP